MLESIEKQLYDKYFLKALLFWGFFFFTKACLTVLMMQMLHVFHFVQLKKNTDLRVSGNIWGVDNIKNYLNYA